MIVTRDDFQPTNAQRLAWFRYQFALIAGAQFNPQFPAGRLPAPAPAGSPKPAPIRRKS